MPVAATGSVCFHKLKVMEVSSKHRYLYSFFECRRAMHTVVYDGNVGRHKPFALKFTLEEYFGSDKSQPLTSVYSIPFLVHSRPSKKRSKITHVTNHTSHVTHTSQIAPHTSHIRHKSLLTRHTYVTDDTRIAHEM